jgi:hypothetical protein
MGARAKQQTGDIMTKPQKPKQAGEFAKIKERTYGPKQPVTSDYEDRGNRESQKRHTDNKPVRSGDHYRAVKKRNGEIFS